MSCHLLSDLGTVGLPGGDKLLTLPAHLWLKGLLVQPLFPKRSPQQQPRHRFRRRHLELASAIVISRRADGCFRARMRDPAEKRYLCLMAPPPDSSLCSTGSAENNPFRPPAPESGSIHAPGELTKSPIAVNIGGPLSVQLGQLSM